ncbi:vanadium-dependent haloperoxidase [Streptomyces spinoverrucosus]|uniref:vanadium-dependent haloperoxidase n=1 Tax=Streptomyces spinoverrucosus TaxID=284043 RepID=UPI0018C42D1C|nr:vanadium-dependent haloperoxidase [Streptomyces spinoverrucosus]MBG0852524.1 vanadium-dependent haloperoxidase [Streptomyces spinoverrucosus]
METTRPSTLRRRTLVVGLTALTLGATTAATVAAPDRAPTAPAPKAQVLLDWNEIAVATINGDAKRHAAEQNVWHGFVSAAVYNAVVGIEGRYAPYKWDVRGPREASAEAAAAAAAHRVLLTYFPKSKARLDAAYTESLKKIPDGQAEKLGVDYGRRAADRVVQLRVKDGRGESVAFTKTPEPGVWRPTPPDNSPFQLPWLAKTKPLALTSAEQFRPGAPPATNTRRYARDLAEVRALGAKNSKVRTPQQTETAKFFADVQPVQFQAAYRDHVKRHGLDLVDAARLFAAANTATADATITAWNAKYTHAQWRPITAIRLAGTDDNAATTADPAWEPLLRTPASPDYVSGHNAADGAAMAVLHRLTGPNVDFRISSAVTGTTRTYTRAADFTRDVINARMWGGVEHRTSGEVGNRMGQQIGRYTLDHYFRPVS